MLQLRNRYQIEKRRLENLQTDYTVRPAESKWPLYSELSFLSDHIQVRRSFRNMSIPTIGRLHHDVVSVKHEEPVEVEMSVDQSPIQQSEPKKSSAIIQVRTDLVPMGSLSNGQQQQQQQQEAPLQVEQQFKRRTYPNALPRLTSAGRRSMRPYASQNEYQNQRRQHGLLQQHQTANQRKTDGSEKFIAFGKFLTASLIQLPESTALTLVDQFTSDVVQACLQINMPTSSSMEEGEQVDNGHVDNMGEP